MSSKELANRLREVYLDGTWIANTNYRQQLEKTDWTVAVRQVGSLNSIALLAQHIHYYINGVKQVLEGGSLDLRDQFSFTFPVIENADQWQQFLGRFFKDAEALASLVEQLPAGKLKESFVDPKYGTYERNLEALIEHGYYHLGQVVLICKFLKAGG